MATNDAAQVPPDSLDLKKRARRRLVGAAALALLAVVVLPAVMDGEPKPAAQDIQIRIPSQDDSAPVRSTAKSPALPPVPQQSQDIIPVPPAPAKAAADAAASGKTEPAKAEGKPDTRPEPKPESKPEVHAEATKPAAKPADGKPQEKTQDKAKDVAKDAAARKAEEARAAAALEGKPAPAASAGGQWIVQLGAYQNAGNVKLLLSKLKELGVPAYTEKLDSADGAKTRVRAGPFPSREAAEKAQTRIKIIGVSGPVGQK